MLLNLSTEANITLVKLYKIALIICVSNGLADIFNPKSIIFEKLEEKTKYNEKKLRRIMGIGIFVIAILLLIMVLLENILPAFFRIYCFGDCFDWYCCNHLSPVTKHVKVIKFGLLNLWERNSFLKGLFILLTFANYKKKPKPHIL